MKLCICYVYAEDIKLLIILVVYDALAASLSVDRENIACDESLLILKQTVANSYLVFRAVFSLAEIANVVLHIVVFVLIRDLLNHLYLYSYKPIFISVCRAADLLK